MRLFGPKTFHLIHQSWEFVVYLVDRQDVGLYDLADVTVRS